MSLSLSLPTPPPSDFRLETPLSVGLGEPDRPVSLRVYRLSQACSVRPPRVLGVGCGCLCQQVGPGRIVLGCPMSVKCVCVGISGGCKSLSVC